ncbi:MAG: hypothetical protein Q8Q20_03775 [bacterium]|nr:hypothetical protein [bacterium]
MQDLNNQVSQADEAERFHEAMNEIENLSRGKKGVLPIGYMVETHGYVFEWTHIGWIIRPNGYISHAEIAKRYPSREERVRFYKSLNAKQRKRFFV